MFNKFSKIFLIIILIISSLGFLSVNADSNSELNAIMGFSHGKDSVPGAGITDPIKTGINDVREQMGSEVITKKEITATVYVQRLVAYFLTFITLIATVYVIYAGFRILTSSGEDDTIKNSKKTIIYVVIGIAIIWFAYEIAFFATNIGEEIKN